MFRHKKQRNLVVKRGFRRTIKKTLISATIMVLLFIVAGVAYVYISGRQPIEQPQAAASTPEIAPFPKHQEPGPNAPESAAVQYLSSPVKAGDNANVVAITGPDSKCTIVVAYNKVVSKDSVLAPKTASTYGSVEWTWTVEKTAAIGKWPVQITCTRNTKVGYVEGTLEVIK